MRKILMAGASMALALGVAVPSNAAAGVVVSGPGGGVNPVNSFTPAVVSPAGTQVQFVNADPIADHNVVSTRMVNGRRLFTSGNPMPAGVYPVTGTAGLAAGSYDFFCTLHPWMEGTLVVV